MVDRVYGFDTYPSAGSTPGRGPAGFVLLHKTKPRWLAANRTAVEIGGSLAKGDSAAAVADRLAAVYGLPLQAAVRDVLQVQERLCLEGFLDPVPAVPVTRAACLQSVYLHVTNRCNLACPHCYYPCGARPADLPASLVFRLIDETAANGGDGIVLSGGEALLHPEIRPMLKRAASKLSVRLLTNGTLLDRGWAEFLADLNVHVQVSLDGATEEVHDGIRGKGTFRKARGAISALQEAGLAGNLVLSATVMKQNVGYLPDIISLARSLGVPVVRFLPLSRRGRAEDTWDDIGAGVSVRDQEAFYDYVAGLQRSRGVSLDVSCGLSGFLLEVPEPYREDGIWCSVGRQVVVDVEGEAFPCVLLMREAFRLGNVRETALIGLVHSQRMTEVCAALTGRRTGIPRCRECSWRNFCQAGCMGQALDNTGTVWDTDSFCAYRKNAYRKAFDRILEREAERIR